MPGAEELRRQWGAALYLDKADAQGTQRLPISKVDGEYTDGGELKVDGRIDSLSYEEPAAARGGLLRRLLG